MTDKTDNPTPAESLPDGWLRTTVQATGNYVNGVAFKPSDWGADGTPIIRIQNLTDPAKPLNRTTRRVAPVYTVRRGDLLVSWSATLDAFRWDRDDALLNQHIFKVVPNTELVGPEFLFYLLRHTIAEMVRSDHLHGSTMQHINRGPFLGFPVAIPPKPVQVAIASRLDELFTDLDAGVAALQRARAKLKRYRASVLKAAVEGRLTAEWREGRRPEAGGQKSEVGDQRSDGGGKPMAAESAVPDAAPSSRPGARLTQPEFEFPAGPRCLESRALVSDGRVRQPPEDLPIPPALRQRSPGAGGRRCVGAAAATQGRPPSGPAGSAWTGIEPTSDLRLPISESGPALLARILAERRQRWEADQLAKFAKAGKTPPQGWQIKYVEPKAPDDASLPALPAGWCWATVEQLAQVVRGASPRPAGDSRYFGGPTPWITVGPLTADDTPYLTSVPSGVTDSGRNVSRYVHPHTLLLTNSGATLGVPKITLIGGCINDGVAALLDVDYPLKLYLHYLLRSLTKRLRAIDQGAAQPNLNTGIIKAISVPLPPLPEQQQIVAEVERRLSVADDVEAQIEADLKRAARLRQAILKRAFAGRLL